MARKNPRQAAKPSMADYRYDEAKRKNNPPAKIAAEGVVPPIPKARYEYSPRMPPVLRFDSSGGSDALPELLAQAKERALNNDEAKLIADVLRNQEPWLEWAGKREARRFEVDPVALHIHERVSAQAILRVAARLDVQRGLFADPQQQYHEAVQFYQHDIDWTNRLILGDSLQVMSSLARREDLAGKVQMIYLDPPYGIKFASNFQSEIGRRDVKDKETDLTREPEMVKAYRDTWTLGVHSYLSYLRDRLIVSRELLTDSGSIFVQISDENLHRVRCLMDEVFLPENFISVIGFQRTGGLSQSFLPVTSDYLLWYARNKETIKFRHVYSTKESGRETDYQWLRLPTGELRRMTPEERDSSHLSDRAEAFQTTSLESANPTFEFNYSGKKYLQRWKSNPTGLDRLGKAERLFEATSKLRFVRLVEDFPALPITNVWSDTGSSGYRDPTLYVVQTTDKVPERCMLMTTDPGDLIVDPTCGSGTTAYVAERWGRRWITIDTSRVAVALARQRLLTAKNDFYKLRDEAKGAGGGFVVKTVPHVMLKSIAQNTNLDPIFTKHQPILDKKLKALNEALQHVPSDVRQKLATKLLEKQRREGKKAITNADRRRWLLPPKNRDAKTKLTVPADFAGWYEWEVPFDIDSDWPAELQSALRDYRTAWRAKMDEVNACITVNAEQEELVDKPEVLRGVVRVSGPFTVEAVQPPEMTLGDITTTFEGEGMFEGEPELVDQTFEMRVVESVGDIEIKNAAAYLEQMTRLLKTDGVRFPNNKQMRFTRLEPLVGTDSGLHAEARWSPEGETDGDPDGHAFVCVGFGPQYGPITAKQVEQLVRDASRRGYDDLLIAGFSFDGPAQAAIEESQRKDLRIHMANIRPDVNPGMAGLLKEQPGSQLFTVFGQPRTRLDGPNEDGEYIVEMEGVDIYNPVDNSITGTGADKVAAWFMDSDYDGWTFCITQAFFPDRTAWDKLYRALNGPGGVIDAERFEALSGTVSLPFPVGKHKTVAVKVIDPRGNEVMKVHKLK